MTGILGRDLKKRDLKERAKVLWEYGLIENGNGWERKVNERGRNNNESESKQIKWIQSREKKY